MVGRIAILLGAVYELQAGADCGTVRRTFQHQALIIVFLNVEEEEFSVAAHLFWNQILICLSVRHSWWAISILRLRVR